MTKFDPNWFKLKTPETKGFCRVGGQHDGGYVLVNDFDDVEHSVSIGVGSDVSYDVTLRNIGIESTLIDGTISRLPSHVPDAKFIRSNWDESAVRIQSHIYDDAENILKFDCEGAEWNCLPLVDPLTLARFSQIVCELHYIDENFDPITLNRLKIFHELVHVHACNFVGTFTHEGKVWPKTIECTFLRKDRDSFSDAVPVLPRPQDSPCNPHSADIPIPLD
jgi:hypothetical protein